MRAGRADVPEDCGGGIIAALEGKEDSERAGSLRTQGTQPPPPPYLRLLQAAGLGLWDRAQMSRGDHAAASAWSSGKWGSLHTAA